MAGDMTAKAERQHVAVIFVHGIHGNVLDFAGKMERKLREQLADDLQPYLQFRSVFWADKVRGNQGDYYGAVQKTRSVRHRMLRKHVIETLGDAAAYQKNSEPAEFGLLRGSRKNRQCHRRTRSSRT